MHKAISLKAQKVLKLNTSQHSTLLYLVIYLYHMKKIKLTNYLPSRLTEFMPVDKVEKIRELRK